MPEPVTPSSRVTENVRSATVWRRARGDVLLLGGQRRPLVVGIGALERGAGGGGFCDHEAGFGHAAQDGGADIGFPQQIGGEEGFVAGENVQHALAGRGQAGLGLVGWRHVGPGQVGRG